MDLGSLFVLLLVLACPLMMVWMMRGHGDHHSHGPHGPHSDDRAVDKPEAVSLVELRRRSDALVAEIEELEGSEPKTPAAV